MPAMANITVKKADGTTDILWTALVPSAGDSVAAKWRSNTVSAIPGHRPTFELMSRDNGTKDGRRIRAVGKYPVIDSSSGVATVVANVPIDVSIMVPQMVDAAQVSEAIAQVTNLIVSALVRTSILDGYAPT